MGQAVSVEWRVGESGRMGELQAPPAWTRESLGQFIREAIAQRMCVPVGKVSQELKISVAAADALGVVLATYGIKIELPRKIGLIRLKEILKSASLY